MNAAVTKPYIAPPRAYREETAVHTRLLKCALEVEEARSYWQHASSDSPVIAREAFDGYWFGAKSLPRVEVLLSNMKARFAAFPFALAVLSSWTDMPPETRKLICHWHLQLADPLYRAFTGEYLVARRAGGRPQVTRDLVVSWVGDQGPERWTMPTRIQFASKLLSAAFAAGLIGSRRDPRPVVVPRVSDQAVEYLMYLLREVSFEGALLQNPYAASVGLDRDYLEERLRGVSALHFERQGDLINYGWQFDDLGAWARARLGIKPNSPTAGDAGS